MSTGGKCLLYFIGGVFVGAGVTYLALKKHFEVKADETIEDVKRAFGERLDEIEDERNKALGIANKAIISAGGYEDGKNPGGRDALNGSGVLRGIVQSSTTNAVDYTKYYSKDGSEVEEETIEEVNEMADETYKEPTVSSSIELISSNDYGHMVGYDFKELYLFAGNNVLVDEDDEVIDDPGYLLGNLMETSEFTSNGEEELYVRNNRISSDFRITKLYQTWDGPV